MTPLLTTLTKPADASSRRRTFILLVATLVLLISSVLFGILWIRKCSTTMETNVNGDSYVHWTILQMNDVYELLPLNEGKKGGLARVAHMRDLLRRENPFTYTVLSGDFLSPSALSQAIVNGTALNGRQMIQTLNTLGIDYVTFGNHEFDLQENELIRRMNESNFTWINSNVFHAATNRTFASSIPYTIVTVGQVRVLLIGLTINAGTKYVDIVDQSVLIPFVQQFLASISHVVEYDVLIALTHLDLPDDERLAESIPQIDLILGGHEHANYFVRRGSRYTPICKADANAFTVFVHRCAFNLRTKQFRVTSTLATITPDVAEQTKTRHVANYWFNLGMDAFRQMGFEPDKIVSCLPEGLELDGRSSSIRNGRTLLSDHGCQSLLRSTTIDATTVALFNVGAMRIDDILTGKITQYDILRILPFPNTLITLAVPGRILAKVLTYGMSLKGNGMFLAYTGVESPDDGKTWLINGTDISTSILNYNLATIDYARSNTGLDDPAVTIIRTYNITQTRSLLEYLSEIYPPC